MVGEPMLWFFFDDLEADLEYATFRFEEKFARKPTILWTRDGQSAPEQFGLVAKKDKQLGVREMYLE